jgi:phytoene/squalene synthetase
VGRLVLRICGYRDASMDHQSDAICTALQLTNFWQDLAVDWRKGRLYVPADLRRETHAEDADLEAGRWPPAWRAAVREAARRTRERFEEGRPLADRVTGRLRHELRATWLGGTRILDKLETLDYDVLHRRPSLGAGDAAAIGWRMLTWRR